MVVATAQIQLGDLPTWLAALGTVGALGAALWQIRTERKRRHECEEQGAGTPTIEKWLEYRDRDSEYGHQVPITTVSILPSGTNRIWVEGTGWGRVLSGRNGAEVAF